MFCNNCGTPMPDTAKFCPKCGTKVEQVNTPPTPHTPPASQPYYQAGPGYQAGHGYQAGPGAPNYSGEKENTGRILLICVIIAAVIVCLLFFLYSQGLLPDIFGNKGGNVVTTGSSDDIEEEDEEEEDKPKPEEKAAFAAAYEDYLQILTDEKSVIDTVGNSKLDLQVSFINLDEDSAPIMILEGLDIVQTETDDSGKDYHYYENHLRAYMYDDNKVWSLFDKPVGFSEWGMSSCSFFRTEDGSLYYAHWESSAGGCHLILEQFDYSEDAADLLSGSTWEFVFDGLSQIEGNYPNHTDVLDTEYWRDQYNGSYDVDSPKYSKNGKVISQADFFNEFEEIIDSIDVMLINNIPEIDIRPVDGDVQKYINLKSHKSSSMTYDEAIEMLDGLLAK